MSVFSFILFLFGLNNIYLNSFKIGRVKLGDIEVHLIYSFG